MKQPPGFRIYREGAIILSMMNDDDAAATIKAMANYYLYGTKPKDLNGIVKITFDDMREKFDRDNEDYQRTCERNLLKIQKRWAGDKGG